MYVWIKVSSPNAPRSSYLYICIYNKIYSLSLEVEVFGNLKYFFDFF